MFAKPAPRRERIFIGIPCYGPVAPEVLEDFMLFAYALGRRYPEYDFFLGVKPKSEQFRARNTIVEGALGMGCDWLLQIDDDMVICTVRQTTVSDQYQFLRAMLAHQKDVLGVLYWQRHGACAPVLMYRLPESTGYRFLRPDEITNSLQPVDVAGGGCMLVNMRIFEKIGAPWFAPEHDYGTDVQLCRKAQEAGFEVWADTSIELGHVREERAVVTKQNRHLYVTETLPGEMRKQVVLTDVFNRLLADAEAWMGADTAQRLVTDKRSISEFLQGHTTWQQGDAAWYRTYPKERVARQIWFNSYVETKRQMTEFILASAMGKPDVKYRVLDFGCGIGIPAYTLAESGHEVTAVDLEGTGTFQFLEWRAAEHCVPLAIRFAPENAPPTDKFLADAEPFDIVIAMDTLEHVPFWRESLAWLVSKLRTDGVLFANNAVLDDTKHPEHYPLSGGEFMQACLDLGLRPYNEFTFIKTPMPAALRSGPVRHLSEAMAHG
jgi:2-polyprenyl-3-methyl-5-hydroxy-6-metoxy-1,4-benzoquinol methylase